MLYITPAMKALFNIIFENDRRFEYYALKQLNFCTPFCLLPREIIAIPFPAQ